MNDSISLEKSATRAVALAGGQPLIVQYLVGERRHSTCDVWVAAPGDANWLHANPGERRLLPEDQVMLAANGATLAGGGAADLRFRVITMKGGAYFVWCRLLEGGAEVSDSRVEFDGATAVDVARFAVTYEIG